MTAHHSPAEATDELRRGVARLKRRDAVGALAHLRRALAAAPDDVTALFHLGRALMANRDAFSAVAAFERVRLRAPNLPGLTDALVCAYRRDARYADALALAEQAPPSQDILFERAVSLACLGEVEAALEGFDALLAVNPGHAAAWFASHAVALHVEGIDPAIRRIERAVACPGANGKYWSYLGAYALLRGRDDQARLIHAEHLARYPRRQALVEAVAAIRPFMTAEAGLFGDSARLLRTAVAAATTPGLVLEFGVRRGTSINHIAAAAGQRVHGFDSFEGLPEGWLNERAGVLTTGAELPPVADNVSLHAGWFDASLPAFLAAHPGPLRFVNIDSDIYSSARTVLTLLTDRLRPGSILVFDEMIGNLTWRDDEYKAFAEFVAATGWGHEVIAVSPFTKQVALRLTHLPDRPSRP